MNNLIRVIIVIFIFCSIFAVLRLTSLSSDRNDQNLPLSTDKLNTEMDKETQGTGYDFVALSDLRIPYVGDNGGVMQIIYHLPEPEPKLRQQFISIGDDYGTSNAPNTLTIYYEPRSDELKSETTLPLADEKNLYLKNMVLLFALIDNLEEVTFAFRDSSTSDGKLHEEDYTNYQRMSRSDMVELLEMDFQDMWDDGLLSVNKAFEKIDNRGIEE